MQNCTDVGQTRLSVVREALGSAFFKPLYSSVPGFGAGALPRGTEVSHRAFTLNMGTTCTIWFNGMYDE